MEKIHADNEKNKKNSIKEVVIVEETSNVNEIETKSKIVLHLAGHIQISLISTALMRINKSQKEKETLREKWLNIGTYDELLKELEQYFELVP